jgi:hypothetical protein
MKITARYFKWGLMKLTITGMWPHHLRVIVETEEQIKSGEEKMGYSIITSYRTYLE